MKKANILKVLLDSSDLSKDSFFAFLEETDGDGKRADFSELADEILREGNDLGYEFPEWATQDFVEKLLLYLADSAHTFVTENKP